MSDKPESPASVLRRAAALMRKRATDATPGPWERPLDVRSKSIVGAALPEDEQPKHYRDGIIPESRGQYPGYSNRYAGQRERVCVVQCSTWSDGTHDRKRNGRDLEYIAAMHPLLGLAVADWLDATAKRAEEDVHWETPACTHEDGPCGCNVTPGWVCDQCDDWLGGGCHCWDAALKVARAYLGETPEVTP